MIRNKMFKRILAIMLALTILVSGMMFSPVDASAANGSWKSDGKGWWFEYPGGDYPSGQWLQISDSWYYFGNDGYMEAECYRDGCWLGSSGAWVPDYSNGHWCSDSVGWWYEDSGWYPTSQWLQIDGSWYYFKADGYMAANVWVDGFLALVSKM